MNEEEKHVPDEESPDDEVKDCIARCFDCKASWIIRGNVVREAYDMLMREFPEGALVAFPMEFGYLCADCQAKREEAMATRRAARKGRTRKH